MSYRKPVEARTTAAESKTSPVNTDVVPLVDATGKLKKLTWLNLKTEAAAAGTTGATGATGPAGATGPVGATGVCIIEACSPPPPSRTSRSVSPAPSAITAHASSNSAPSGSTATVPLCPVVMS